MFAFFTYLSQCYLAVKSDLDQSLAGFPGVLAAHSTKWLLMTNSCESIFCLQAKLDRLKGIPSLFGELIKGFFSGTFSASTYYSNEESAFVPHYLLNVLRVSKQVSLVFVSSYYPFTLQ